jgi:hypothetical protein
MDRPPSSPATPSSFILLRGKCDIFNSAVRAAHDPGRYIRRQGAVRAGKNNRYSDICRRYLRRRWKYFLRARAAGLKAARNANLLILSCNSKVRLPDIWMQLWALPTDATNLSLMIALALVCSVYILSLRKRAIDRN